MKRILLDTHAFIWALENPALLSPEARELIETKENRIFISQIRACLKNAVKKIGS